MKKLFCSLLAGTLLLSMTACGGGAGGANENVLDNPGPATGEITVSMTGGVKEIQVYNEIFDAFEEANPGITVESVWYGNFDVLYQDLITSIAPDVICADADVFSGWMQAGAIKSLQPFVTSENYDLSDFWPQLIEIGSYDKATNKKGTGDLYGLPKDYGVTGIFVNTDLINAGVSKGYITEEEKAIILDREHPMTFEKYVELAAKLTVKDSNGKAVQYGTNTIPIPSYVWSHGSDYIKEGKYFNAEDQHLIDAYQLAQDICNPASENYCTPTYEDVKSVDNGSLFMSGKTAMLYAGRWYAATFEDVGFNWSCIPLPVAEEGQEPISFASSVLYGISHCSKKNQMAWKLVQFLASPEAYRIMNRLNYAVPGRISLTQEDQFKDPMGAGLTKKMSPEDAAVFFNIAKHAKVAPNYYFSSNRWTDVLTQYEADVYSGAKTAAQMLKDAELDINAAIRSSNPELFK